LAFFFIFFFCYCAFVVSFGRKKRARHFEFSFVRSLFPHCIIIISRRDERTTLLLTTTTREKERKRERDLRVWARVFVDFFCRASLSSSIEEEEETSKKNATEEDHHHGRRRRRRRKRTNRRRRRELEAKVTGGIFPRQQRHRRV